MMAAIAFVPLDDVEDCFDLFAEQIPDDFRVVADYFEVIYK